MNAIKEIQNNKELLPVHVIKFKKTLNQKNNRYYIAVEKYKSRFVLKSIYPKPLIIL